MKEMIIMFVVLLPAALLRLYLRKIEVDVALAFSALFGVTGYLAMHYFHVLDIGNIRNIGNIGNIGILRQDLGITSIVIAIGSYILMRAEGRNVQP